MLERDGVALVVVEASRHNAVVAECSHGEQSVLCEPPLQSDGHR